MSVGRIIYEGINKEGIERLQVNAVGPWIALCINKEGIERVYYHDYAVKPVLTGINKEGIESCFSASYSPHSVMNVSTKNELKGRHYEPRHGRRKQLYQQRMNGKRPPAPGSTALAAYVSTKNELKVIDERVWKALRKYAYQQRMNGKQGVGGKPLEVGKVVSTKNELKVRLASSEDTNTALSINKEGIESGLLEQHGLFHAALYQ